MEKKTRPIFVGGFPWLEPSDSLVATSSNHICRGYVIMPYSNSQVFCDACRDPLPQVARWTDSNRKVWCKFELPRGDSEESGTRLIYTGDSPSEQLITPIPLGSGISRSFLDELLEGAEAPTGSQREYSRIRDQIDTHIELINDLADRERSKKFYWEGDTEGLAIRSVRRVTSHWNRSAGRDQARIALIVKLARDISGTLRKVCDHPRVVLRRTREFQKLAKIQEVDPACLRWLAKQPGRDVYERAGARQELLGVVRKEDTDTLENRVVKDLLYRARIECANYVAIHREFSSHDRVRTVSSFRNQIIDWERTSDIHHAKRIIGAVQPNYVLLHEAKYRKLWEAYQLLLSQQKQKDDIWKWRDRTFSESCEIGCLSVLQRFSRSSMFSRSDVAIHSEAVTGRFISTLTEFGPAKLKSTGTRKQIVFCRGIQVNRYPYMPPGLFPLAADFVLVVESNNSAERLVPVWCFNQVNEAAFADGVLFLENKLNRLQQRSVIWPLILVYDSQQLQSNFFGNQGSIVNIDFPLAGSIPKLAPLLLGESIMP